LGEVIVRGPRLVLAASFVALVASSNVARAQDPAEKFTGTWRRDDGRLYKLERGAAPGELTGQLLDPPSNAEVDQHFRSTLRLKVNADRVHGVATWVVANPKRGQAGEPDELAAESSWDLTATGRDRLAGEVEWLEWEEGHVKKRGSERHTFDRIPVVNLTAHDPNRTDAERIAALEATVTSQAKRIDDLEAKKAPTAPGAVADASKQTPASPQWEWGYNEGFFVKGQIHDEKFEIRPRARLQVDYRAFPHSAQNDLYQNKPPQDLFTVRRMRVGFEGSFTQYFYFDLEADPTRNTASQLLLGDCFFEFRPLPDELRFRFGQYKTPITLDDGMTSDLYLDFLERPMMVGSGNQLAPDFHIGAEVYGSFAKGLLKYWLSCQNQPQNATVASGDPMTCARVASEFFGIELGVAGCWENRSGTPPAKTAPRGRSSRSRGRRRGSSSSSRRCRCAAGASATRSTSRPTSGPSSRAASSAT
jgi:hypothetical protein